MTEPFELNPIGWVRSAYPTRESVPNEGGPAEIEIAETFAAGLEDLELSSHLIVLAWFDRAHRDVLRVRPRRAEPGAPERGVFSTRSPDRPNPVAVTVVPLLGRDGRRLRVEALDFADGTPIVDLKSYCPGWDSVFCATRQRRSPAALPEDRQRWLGFERDLVNHLGQASRAPEARLALAAVFLASRAFGVEPRDPRLSARVPAADAAADALMGLMGATFASDRLRIEASSRFGIGFRFLDRELWLDEEALEAARPD